MQVQPFVGRKRNLAFTVVELMTVIVIMSILITAAIPGFENFMRNNQAFIIATRLESSLQRAQAEAISRGIPVTVCPIGSNFNPTTAFNQASEQYPCLNTTTWDAWKVFIDPNFSGVENFSDGWPIILYVGGDFPEGTVTSNVSGRITFDPMGFANLNPSTTRAGWTWSSSYSSGDWAWSYAYSSPYNGSYTDRLFTIVPEGCSGNNARIVEVTQNGVITTANIDCYGI